MKARSKELLDRSISAMLGAIEIYNKPSFPYRMEAFTILAINGWELLLKAKWLADNKNQEKSLYVYEERTIRADVIASSKKLNARQAGLVAAFLERSKLSLAECEKLFPEVPRRTMQRDLKILSDAGLVARTGHPTDPGLHYRWQGERAL